MVVIIGGKFKMTLKTKVYLKFYYFFHNFERIAQWFITHCDIEEVEA